MLQCNVGYGSANLLLHKSTARQHVHGSEFLTAHLEEKKKKKTLNEANLARSRLYLQHITRLTTSQSHRDHRQATREGRMNGAM